MTAKLWEDYPEAIELDGETYALRLDFRSVLRALELTEDENWTARERAELQLGLLLEDPAQVPEGFAERLRLLGAIFSIFPRQTADEQREKHMDFVQDAGLIRSAFFRMGVDLTRENIHFFKFLELLGDVPEDTALARTIQIRAKPIPAANGHNQEEIAALLKAKQRVALEITEEERRRHFAASLKNSAVLRG